jgi:propanol-preferring alcohol dehydrogenase
MILKTPAPLKEKPLEPVDIDIPRLGPGQVLVKVSICGLCHTDIHTAEGDLALPVLPIIPGHQIVGEVVERGEGVTTPEPGTRVGAAWLGSACGTCRWCVEGKENLCEEARFNGFHYNGGYAQYTALPADFVYPLPEGFSDRDVAPLLCAGIIGYRSLRIAGIERGGTLGMYGFGASAHVAIQIALHWGCAVYVFTRSEGHRRHAEDLGAAWTGGPGDRPPKKPDASIIFAPAGEIVPHALENVTKGGTVACAGITMTEIPPLDYENHLYHEKILRSVANATRQNGRELLELAAAIPIRTDTTLFGLEECNEALLKIKKSEISGSGVLEIP